jgi:putative tryptophan/tyrosine transport system substrate-binding protein
MPFRKLRRREFITLLGGAAAWPIAASAQQADRMRRVGVLNPYTEDDSQGAPVVAAFQQRLQGLGWAVGRNIQIDKRFGATNVVLYRTYAAELVGLAPDVILASTTPTLQALVQQTHTIPIVFYQVSDPLGDGFVASLARPGGNVTGFANNEFSISGKWLELLKDVAPKANRVMVILDPENATWRGYYRTIEAVAPTLGVQVIATPVVDAAGIERAIGDFGREPNGGLVVLPGPNTGTHQALIVALAARHHLPATYPTLSAVRGGGLMIYGTDLLDQARKAAGYIDRILKGEKPGDLPVQQPTKFNLTINLKTAKALGLTVPQSLLAIADEVIE